MMICISTPMISRMTCYTEIKHNSTRKGGNIMSTYDVRGVSGLTKMVSLGSLVSFQTVLRIEHDEARQRNGSTKCKGSPTTSAVKDTSFED